MQSQVAVPASTRIASLLLMAALLGGCSDDGSETAMAQASDPAVAGTVESCKACHGAQGQGNRDLGAPVIANLDDWYLKRQLQGFRDGLRGAHEDDERGAQMRAMSLNLADESLEGIVAAIQAMGPVPIQPSVEGNAENGRDYYNMICGACHGPEAKGNEMLNAPSLKGIDGWYLVEQFEKFRAGVRGTHPADKYGRQMQFMAKALPTIEEVRDVAAYLESLEP
jgi:cytochrome c oxidase subunit 2